MPEDNRLDVAGLGEIAKSIPPESWNKLVETATNTFRSLIKPLTALSEGIGGLIEQKFERMTDIEKIVFADGFDKAQKRIHENSQTITGPKNLRTFNQLVENVSQCTESMTREMWINLLARDLSDAAVHPEFINILSRLSGEDARLLIDIEKDSEEAKQTLAGREFRKALLPQSQRRDLTAPMLARLFHAGNKPFDLGRAVLESLGLVAQDGGEVFVTEFGMRFLEAVSEPDRIEAATIPTSPATFAEGSCSPA